MNKVLGSRSINKSLHLWNVFEEKVCEYESISLVSTLFSNVKFKDVLEITLSSKSLIDWPELLTEFLLQVLKIGLAPWMKK